jgi:hypothetical protein
VYIERSIPNELLHRLGLGGVPMCNTAINIDHRTLAPITFCPIILERRQNLKREVALSLPFSQRMHAQSILICRQPFSRTGTLRWISSLNLTNSCPGDDHKGFSAGNDCQLGSALVLSCKMYSGWGCKQVEELSPSAVILGNG